MDGTGKGFIISNSFLRMQPFIENNGKNEEENYYLNGGDGGDNNERDINYERNEEKKHFQKIINIFINYKTNSLRRLNKSLSYLDTLSVAHRNKLSKYRLHLIKVKECIKENSKIMRLIVDNVNCMFENADYLNIDNTKLDNQTTNNGVELIDFSVNTNESIDQDKAHMILKQIVREWSNEGYVERNRCFKAILDEINLEFGNYNRKEINILVPGAGLGRLAFEIAKEGYKCEGNEFSLIMLFVSNFILNKCCGTNLYHIYPWVHQYINNLKSCDQIKQVKFPDINPSLLPIDSNFSMIAGNFIEIYKEPEKWNCVATCFFIDTAHNVLRYIETIYNILRKGGLWINFGPLLYHFADSPFEDSIEPSYDILRELIESYGFKFIREQTSIRCNYTQNLDSMLTYEYKCIFFVCRKP